MYSIVTQLKQQRVSYIHHHHHRHHHLRHTVLEIGENWFLRYGAKLYEMFICKRKTSVVAIASLQLDGG